MAKITIQNFETWVKTADEELVICAKAKLLKERYIANQMLSLINKRLAELNKITPEKIINA